MNHADPPHRFPLATALVAVTATALAVWGLGLWSFGVLFPNTEALTALVSLAVVAVWGVSVLALAPLSLLGPFGVMATVYGYFIGTGLRLVVCLGVFGLVKSGGVLEAQPLAVALAAAYLPLLGVETFIVGRYLWAKDFISHDPPVRPLALTDGAGDRT